MPLYVGRCRGCGKRLDASRANNVTHDKKSCKNAYTNRRRVKGYVEPQYEPFQRLDDLPRAEGLRILIDMGLATDAERDEFAALGAVTVTPPPASQPDELVMLARLQLEALLRIEALLAQPQVTRTVTVTEQVTGGARPLGGAKPLSLPKPAALEDEFEITRAVDLNGGRNLLAQLLEVTRGE